MNLEKMSTEELEKMFVCIGEELKKRRESKQLVLYTHDCFSQNSYHLDRYKHWAKLVTNVNTNKTNGYAFAGDFLNVKAEHKLPLGSVIVEVCGDDIACYKLDTSGKTRMFEGKTRKMSSFIGDVSTLF